MEGRGKLLAIASGGGHWVQLLRLRPAFEGYDVAYVATLETCADQVHPARFYTVAEASRFSLIGFVPALFQSVRIILKERPSAIVTTGAAPMLVILAMGRLMRARTLWVDSIANAERLSTSGRIARHIAHQVVSQWADVAEAEGVAHWGAVL